MGYAPRSEVLSNRTWNNSTSEPLWWSASVANIEEERREPKKEFFWEGKFFHNQGSGNERLWQAVIYIAVSEWVHGSDRNKRKADHFLSQDEDGFPFVCR